MIGRRPAQAAVEEAARRAVVSGARRILDERLVVGTTGNISARVGRRIWITPSRTAYRALRPNQLAEVDLDSGAVQNAATASLELPLHLAAYAARPDVAAVVHTHSVHATAWSFLGCPLEPATEDLTYHDVGTVVTCAGPAGTQDLARSVSTALSCANAVLVAKHGVVAVGGSVAAAITVAAVVEHVAQIAWLVREGQI
jgi:L-fuculose-phosphate aldolase